MQAAVHAPLGLYPTLLGETWNHLDGAVRRFHCTAATVYAAGTFQVRHGSHWLARALARLARLPTEGRTAVELVATRRDCSEEWRRDFAGQTVTSAQFPGPDGLLAERFGKLEVYFRLEEVDGALSYRSVSSALRLGSLRVPLAGKLSPRGVAWERPVGGGEQVEVFVDICVPLLGRLLAYEGRLDRVEVRGCGSEP